MASPGAARADALKRAERATHGNAPSHSSSGGSSTRWQQSSSCNGACDDGFALAYFAGMVLGSPWWVPHHLEDPTLSAGFAPYPFADGTGLLRSYDPSDPYAVAPRRVLLQLDAETGFLLQGVVPGTFSARLLLPYRMELAARASLLSDFYETPAKYGASGTVHFVVRHAQLRRVDFRTGIGMRAFAYERVQLGFDLLYAIDGYIARNMVLRIDLHVGSLANAVVGQARATFGVMVQRTELYAGWDQTGIAGPESSARLGGPVAGMRTWF